MEFAGDPLCGVGDPLCGIGDPLCGIGDPLWGICGIAGFGPRVIEATNQLGPLTRQQPS
jgi:hypothetical protein